MNIDVCLESAQLELGAHSPRMREVVAIAERVARTDSTVLVTGESGVGKERLAQYIHSQSARGRAPFVAINCGALTPTLLESELFGHRRGAFTGAHVDRPGLFEAANSGTLFLDEIGEMPADMQTALLRVLQERQVRRVGENQPRRVDVRIVAATNRDLKAEGTAHRFRWDLYYRISVIVIRIPALRERPDDLDWLLRSFLDATGHRLQRSFAGYTPAALAHLRQYSWPGNIRELQNVIEYASIMATTDQIGVDDLPDHVRDPDDVVAASSPAIPTLQDREREHILAVLQQTGGDRRLTAQTLNIGIATLYRKLRIYRQQGWTINLIPAALSVMCELIV